MISPNELSVNVARVIVTHHIQFVGNDPETALEATMWIIKSVVA